MVQIRFLLFYQGREMQCGCSALHVVSVPSKIEYCIMRWLAVRLEMDSAGICHKLPNNEVIFINVLGILISLPALLSGRHLHQNLPESVRSLLLFPKQGGKKMVLKVICCITASNQSIQIALIICGCLHVLKHSIHFLSWSQVDSLLLKN